MKRYIVAVDDDFNFYDVDAVHSVEELTTCRDCGMYGLEYPRQCEFFDKCIPSYSFCSFASPVPKKEENHE